MEKRDGAEIWLRILKSNKIWYGLTAFCVNFFQKRNMKNPEKENI